MLGLFAKRLLWVLLVSYIVFGYDVLFNSGKITQPEWYGNYYSLADAMEDGFYDNK